MYKPTGKPNGRPKGKRTPNSIGALIATLANDEPGPVLVAGTSRNQHKALVAAVSRMALPVQAVRVTTLGTILQHTSDDSSASSDTPRNIANPGELTRDELSDLIARAWSNIMGLHRDSLPAVTNPEPRENVAASGLRVYRPVYSIATRELIDPPEPMTITARSYSWDWHKPVYSEPTRTYPGTITPDIR
jgi:hypothetical protein